MSADDAGARRQALLARQAERAAQRERDRVVADFERWHVPYLREAGIDAALAWPWEDPPAGPLGDYPFAVSGIRWSAVPGATDRPCHDASEAGPALAAAFAALGIPATQPVHLRWDGGAMPQLVLPAAQAVRHLGEFGSWSSDLWVFDPDASWIVELYHEGRLSFAAAPPRR